MCPLAGKQDVCTVLLSKGIDVNLLDNCGQVWSDSCVSNLARWSLMERWNRALSESVREPPFLYSLKFRYMHAELYLEKKNQLAFVLDLVGSLKNAGFHCPCWPVAAGCSIQPSHFSTCVW